MSPNTTPSLAPWLTVADSAKAVKFYKSAFGATETYRLEDPGGGLVVRFSVGSADFWISDGHTTSQPLGGNSIRLILTVPNPETVFAQALAAGAIQVFPVGDAHGWRLGRLSDPFGLHWEIGHPLDE